MNRCCDIWLSIDFSVIIYDLVLDVFRFNICVLLQFDYWQWIKPTHFWATQHFFMIEMYICRVLGKNTVDGGVTVYEWREETVFFIHVFESLLTQKITYATGNLSCFDEETQTIVNKVSLVSTVSALSYHLIPFITSINIPFRSFVYIS